MPDTATVTGLPAATRLQPARGFPLLVLSIAFDLLAGAAIVSVWFYPSDPAPWLLRAPLALAAAGVLAGLAALGLRVTADNVSYAHAATVFGLMQLPPALALFAVAQL